MQIAALYDIHGNLPALEAVLAELERADVDEVVVVGDVVLCPMPRETLERLVELDRPVHFIHANCELAVLAQMAASKADVCLAPVWWTPDLGVGGHHEAEKETRCGVWDVVATG